MLSEITSPEKEVQTSSAEALRDFLETDFKASYYPTTLDDIRLLPGGLVEFGGQQMPYAQGFLESTADYIRMPRAFAYGVPAELFRLNFEQLKEARCKGVTVCCHRGVAINVTDAEYRPVRTIDVLAGVIDDSFWKLNDARISDRGIDINFIRPGISATPSPGDVVQLGVRLANSETGFGILKGSRFSLRLICSNGAVMVDEFGTARWNSDLRMRHETSVERFQKDLFKLGEGHVRHASIYDHVTRRILLDREFVNLWRRMRGILPVSEVDLVLGIEAEERQAIQAAVRTRTAGLPPEPTAHHVWNIHNRITAAAQRLNFVRRSRLERIGGALLWEPSSN